MQEGYYVIRTYEAGEVGEKTKFFVPGKLPDGQLSRRQKNAIRKQAQNAYSSQKNLARIINANFTKEDVLIGLDYSDAGLQKITAWAESKSLIREGMEESEVMNALWEAASHELDNALRRVKRILKKEGKELRAVYCTADMDGDTGEAVRVHHHLVVNGEAREAFQKAWAEYGLGTVEWDNLWPNQIDRTRLAEYFMKQLRRIPDAKKYRCTRNVVHPVAKDRVVYTDNELLVPKGGKLIFRQEVTNSMGAKDYRNKQPQYIRYITPKALAARSKGE